MLHNILSVRGGVILVTAAISFFCSDCFAQLLLNPSNSIDSVVFKNIKPNQHIVHKSEDVIVLDFEGLGNVDNIQGFYSGSKSSQGYSGPDYGIYFSNNSLSIIAGYAGGSGNIQNEPSPHTVLFFLDGEACIMNVPAGFAGGFSFYYSSINEYGFVRVFDDLNGMGNLLATITLEPLGSLSISGGDYNIWAPVGVAFSGIAKSISFGGVQNEIGFDDVTFGSTIPGQNQIKAITLDANDIRSTSAIVGGEVTIEGDTEVTDKGVQWGDDPDVLRIGKAISAGNGPGLFEMKLEDLYSNTTYYYTAYATNNVGTAYGSIKSFTTKSEQIFIPNAFMPSSTRSDNQVFKPSIDGNPSFYSLKIFNRWGAQIFVSNEASLGWDGKWNNTEAPQGSYAYLISFIDNAGDKQEYKGIIILVR